MRMPFGKYRGLEITDLPDDYLEWLHSKDFLHGILRNLVIREYELRCSNHRPRYSPSDAAAAPPRVPEIIDAGFKVLCRKHHPDLGGTNDAMRETLEAREFLMRRYR